MFDLQKKRVFIATIMALLFATMQPVLQVNTHIAIAQTAAAQVGTVQTGSNSLGQVVVAADGDPILLFLTELSVLVLENAGYEVIYRKDIGDSSYSLEYLPNADAPELSTEISSHKSLHERTIDYHWAHPQKSLAEHLGVDSSLIPNNAQKAWRLALATDDKYTELSWLGATEFYDAYSLLIRPGTIAEDLTSIQELADILNEDNSDLRLCVDAEFYGAENGLQALQAHYRFAFLDENVSIVDPSSLYEALATDQCDVSLGNVIDWQVAAFGLQSLADPEDFFPMYSPAPMVLDDFLSQRPELGELFASITAVLDADTMSRLNVRMQAGADGIPQNGDEESIEDVARSFLVDKKLLPKPDVVVASKNYTEQFILGQMLALLLEDAGYSVTDKIGFGDTNAVRAAMLNGEIDVLIDLTGDALTTYHNLPSPALPSDPQRAFELIRGLDVANGIEWLELGAFNNAHTLMVRDDYVQLGISTIDDLATAINAGEIAPRICIESIFYSQGQDGFDALQEAYGFQFDEQLIELMDIDSVYDGLLAGDCDIALGNITDGRGSAWGFTNLEDTKAFFLRNNPSPVARRAILDANPELRTLLTLVVPYLDNATMSRLNAQVDIGADGIFNSGDEETPRKVAERFLQQQKLLKLPPIVVASQDYTEQYVLGNILLLLLEDAGYEVIDKNRLGSLEVVRQSILNDEIDVVFELTGDALSVHHGLPSVAMPSDPVRSFELARSLDTENDLVWLGLGPFNDTWTLMVRDDLLEKGIATIDELGEYVNKGADLPRICIESVFFSRPQDGFEAMQELYEFQLPDEFIELMDVDSAYEGLRSGECDIAQGYGTDGRGDAWGFTNLEDTRSFFPFYSPAPVVRGEVLAANPELADLLTSVLPYLDNETMRSLNARVDIGADGLYSTGDEETPRDVARAFLDRINGNVEPAGTNVDTPAIEGADEATVGEAVESAVVDGTEEQPAGAGQAPSAEVQAAPAEADDLNLDTSSDTGTDTEPGTEPDTNVESVENPEVLDAEVQAGSLSEELKSSIETLVAENRAAPQIITTLVGSVEQQLMSEMIMLMLEDVGYDVLVEDIGASGEDARTALDGGDIDFYAEITRDALSSVYGLPESTLPTEPERSLRLIQRLDEPKDVAWLATSEVNSASTLVVLADFADNGVATIEDLAALTREADERPSLCIEKSALESIPFGLERLQETYRMVFLPEDILVTEQEDLYTALREGRCDAAQGIGTDGHIAGWNLVPLEDTLNFFPAAIPAPAVRQELLDENPRMASYLEELHTHLTTDRYRALSAQIIMGTDGEIDSGDEVSVRGAAQLFLCDSGLITKCSASDIVAATPVVEDVAPASIDLTDSASADTAKEGAAEEVNDDVEPDAVVDLIAPILANPLLPTLDNTQPSVEITIPEEYGVNARFTSNTDSTVVEVLARGSKATAIGRVGDNSWLQLELPDGRLVWVFTEAVFYSTGAIDSLPIVSPPLNTTP